MSDSSYFFDPGEPPQEWVMPEIDYSVNENPDGTFTYTYDLRPQSMRDMDAVIRLIEETRP